MPSAATPSSGVAVTVAMMPLPRSAANGGAQRGVAAAEHLHGAVRDAARIHRHVEVAPTVALMHAVVAIGGRLDGDDGGISKFDGDIGAPLLGGIAGGRQRRRRGGELRRIADRRLALGLTG